MTYTLPTPRPHSTPTSDLLDLFEHFGLGPWVIDPMGSHVRVEELVAAIADSFYGEYEDVLADIGDLAGDSNSKLAVAIRKVIGME